MPIYGRKKSIPMSDVATLLDLLNSAHGVLWMEISEELLALGYTWEYSAAGDCYRLIDLGLSSYFA